MCERKNTPTHRPMNERQNRKMAWAEWGAALLITLAAIHLHWLFLHHAGGLWRDEVSSVQVATQPTLPGMWRMLKYDSCPVLLHLAVRAWTAIGLGGSDLHLRWLGFASGLALLASLWCAAQLMRRGVPVVSLALLALNPTVIRAGDSLRAYGLGSALVILALALVWRFTRQPAAGTGLLAACAAVLSVQCLYQNAFLVLAACCGAAAVSARERQLRKALWVAGIGAAAAISLVPYVPTIQSSQDVYVLAKAGFQPALIWDNASQAMSWPRAGFDIVWVSLVLLALGRAGLMARRGAETLRASAGRDLALFAAVATVAGIGGFVLFLMAAALPTQPWYYLLLLAFVAVCLDAILAGSGPVTRAALIAFAALTALAAYPPALPAMKDRQTNVDLLAARLTAETGPNDLIIVHPFYCGSTFHRYYRGGTPWTTLPPLEDCSLQRYDLFKAKMQMENPIQPVLDRVAATLQAGNRVWLVGRIPLNAPPPPDIRPAPNNPWGWLDEPYSQVWGAEAGYFISTHATQGAVVVNPSTNRVNRFENLPLVVVSGWASPPSSAAPP
jgi:hypothetical protein